MGLVGNDIDFDGEYIFQRDDNSSSITFMSQVHILVNAKF
jgi:hypothetical protein